jgi:carbonic anhydrase
MAAHHGRLFGFFHVLDELEVTMHRVATFNWRHATPEVPPFPVQDNGQDCSAKAFLITCTDPVLDSSLLQRFRSQPWLVWRSTGPVVPPYGTGRQDIEAAVEHAVNGLGIKEIAICGHLPGEPLRALVENEAALEGPAEDPCLYYARAARRIVGEKYGELKPDELLQAVVEENVFVQMANLRTYPAVLAGLARGDLTLHSWIYDADKDELFGHGSRASRFLKRIREPASMSRPLPYLDPRDIYLA